MWKMMTKWKRGSFWRNLTRRKLEYQISKKQLDLDKLYLKYDKS
jgi:hypothetical protein